MKTLILGLTLSVLSYISVSQASSGLHGDETCVLRKANVAPETVIDIDSSDTNETPLLYGFTFHNNGHYLISCPSDSLSGLLVFYDLVQGLLRSKDNQ